MTNKAREFEIKTDKVEMVDGQVDSFDFSEIAVDGYKIEGFNGTEDELLFEASLVGSAVYNEEDNVTLVEYNGLMVQIEGGDFSLLFA